MKVQPLLNPRKLGTVSKIVQIRYYPCKLHINSYYSAFFVDCDNKKVKFSFKILSTFHISYILGGKSLHNMIKIRGVYIFIHILQCYILKMFLRPCLLSRFTLQIAVVTNQNIMNVVMLTSINRLDPDGILNKSIPLFVLNCFQQLMYICTGCSQKKDLLLVCDRGLKDRFFVNTLYSLGLSTS